MKDKRSHAPFGYPEPQNKGECGFCYGRVSGPSKMIDRVLYHSACALIVEDKVDKAARARRAG